MAMMTLPAMPSLLRDAPPMQPPAAVNRWALLSALAAGACLILAAHFAAPKAPTAADLAAVAPDAGPRGEAQGEVRITAVIPARLAAVAPNAVRVERRGNTANTPQFGLCLGGTTSGGYRLGFADPAPGQQLLSHGVQGEAVVAAADRPSTILTDGCSRPAEARAYSLRFAEAAPALDRAVTVVVTPQ